MVGLIENKGERLGERWWELPCRGEGPLRTSLEFVLSGGDKAQLAATLQVGTTQWGYSGQLLLQHKCFVFEVSAT